MNTRDTSRAQSDVARSLVAEWLLWGLPAKLGVAAEHAQAPPDAARGRASASTLDRAVAVRHQPIAA